MDHRSFLRTLPAAERQRLAGRSDLRGILHLAGHLGLILASGSVIALGLPGWWLLLPLHGVLVTFLFCLAHETTHRTPFATEWLNDWAGRLAGAPILLPLVWFRYFHLAHHRFTNDPKRDPELRAGAKPDGGWALALYLSGLPYWWSAWRQLLRNAGRGPLEAYVPTRARGRVRLEARLYLALYGAALGSLWVSSAVLWLWIVPVLLGQPVLRLYLLAEHGRCPPVADMFANTRTTYTNRAIRFVTWNMPYHAEHHAMPQVPFFRLPALSRQTAPYLKVTARGHLEATRDALGRG